MADKKEDMGAVTHQLSAVDDDMRKDVDVHEKTVASVALGMLVPVMGLRYTDPLKPLLSKLQSLTCGRET